MNEKITVGILLINPKKEILLQLRDNNPEIAYPGYWGAIGGGIEPNETPLDAIEREIKEEINIKVENITYLEEINILEANRKLLLFRGEIDEKAENIFLTEGQEVRYFKIEDIEKIHAPDFFKEFILKNKEKIIKS